MRSPISSDDLKVFSLISELSQALRCCQHDGVFGNGVTFSQFFILNTIAGKEEMELSELHRILAVKKSTTTRLIEPLARHGLIARERSQRDSRAFNVKLTRKGGKVHRRVWECMTKFMASIRTGIPAGKEERVFADTRIFLKALRGACEEKK